MPRPLSIFEEMDQMMEKIEKRAFGLFQERGSRDGTSLDDWFRAEAELVRVAPVEIEERDNEVIVRAEVPGFEAKELSVRADPYGLCIYGKSEQKTEADKKGHRHYSEISSNEVCRHVGLPTNINPDKASASLDKGLLEIKLPKAAPPKLVEIKTAA
jgi:HSP20 family protein